MVSLENRNVLLIYNSKRVTYSDSDILIEDSIEQQEHPYALYDTRGNILETNLCCCKAPLKDIYDWTLESALMLMEGF